MMVNPDLWEHIGSPPNAANDRTRTAFAVLFATECLAFIVRHELAHLVLGHCDFVAPKGEIATIEDTDGRLPAGADAITIQALEVAADGHSAIWVKYGFFEPHETATAFGKAWRPSAR